MRRCGTACDQRLVPSQSHKAGASITAAIAEDDAELSRGLQTTDTSAWPPNPRFTARMGRATFVSRAPFRLPESRPMARHSQALLPVLERPKLGTGIIWNSEIWCSENLARILITVANCGTKFPDHGRSSIVDHLGRFLRAVFLLLLTILAVFGGSR